LELGFIGDIVPLNHTIWNDTNVINTNCILANLNALTKKQQESLVNDVDK